MNIAEYKHNLIEKALRESCGSSDKASYRSELFNLLMSDTHKGKLYKYRSFDIGGYALQNLEEGTLHCAKPCEFNDPFDCKIGITMHNFIESFCKSQIDLCDSVCEKCFDVLLGKTPIQMCKPEEQRIIMEMQKNKKLMEFLRLCGSSRFSQQKKHEEIKRHGFEILTIITSILTEKIFRDQMPYIQCVTQEMLKNISQNGTLDMDVALKQVTYSDVARAYGIEDDDDEIGLCSALIQKIAPNSAETANKLEEKLHVLENNIFDSICEKFRICCLCTDHKNNLMWSHYADCHKGFCIEYDFSDIPKNKWEILPMPVEYSKERPQLVLENMFFQSENNEKLATQSLMRALLTKDSSWKYENEWRILCEADESDNDNIKMPLPSCVYVGANADNENIKKIIDIANNYGFPVKRMKLDRGNYSLHVDPENLAK